MTAQRIPINLAALALVLTLDVGSASSSAERYNHQATAPRLLAAAAE